MDSTTKERNLTVAEGSDTSAAGERGSIVPATPSSSSNVGPPLELGASSSGEVAIASTSKDSGTFVVGGARPRTGFLRPAVQLTRVDTGGKGFVKPVKPGPLSRKMRRTRDLTTKVDKKRREYVSPTRAGFSSETLSSLTMSSDEDSMEVDAGVDVDALLEAERGPGRPPTTGEYVGITEARAARLQLLEKELRLKEALYVLDPSVPPKKTRGRASLPSEEEMKDDLIKQSTTNLFVRAVKHLKAVDKTSDVSKGLQSTLGTELRRAAREVQVTLCILLERIRGEGWEKRPSPELTSALEIAKRLEKEKEEAELEIQGLRRSLATARSELVSARASISPSRRMPSPKRKLRIRGETRAEELESMEVDVAHMEWAQHIPSTRSTTVDRGTSPKTVEMEELGPIRLAEVEALLERNEELKRELERTREEMVGVVDSSISSIQTVQRENRELRKKVELLEKGGKALSSIKKKGDKPMEGSSARKGGGISSGDVPGGKGGEKPTELWTKVVGRRAKMADKRPQSTSRVSVAPRAEKQTGSEQAPKSGKTRRRARKKKKKRGPRVPTTAAVTVTIEGTKDSGLTYAGVLGEAREKISLAELGIDGSRLRAARTGGVIIEIPGKDRLEKARLLAGQMQHLFGERQDVKIAQPQKTSELRVRGVDISSTSRDVSLAIASLTGCTEGQVRVGEVRRNSNNGPGSVWVRCPVAVASKLARAGKLQVGWGEARVELLKARPTICYRCLGHGHVRARCKAAVDRSATCYRCGEPGHSAKGCVAQPKCLACADLGLPATHRLGGKGCKPKPPSRRLEDVPLAERMAAMADPRKSAAVRKKAGRAAESPPATSDDNVVSRPSKRRPK